MMRPSRRILAGVLLALLTGCGGAGQGDNAAEAAPADTAAGLHPRSPAEIEEAAEPMTPDRAEELGVVDTTIQVGEEP